MALRVFGTPSPHASGLDLGEDNIEAGTFKYVAYRLDPFPAWFAGTVMRGLRGGQQSPPGPSIASTSPSGGPPMSLLLGSSVSSSSSFSMPSPSTPTSTSWPAPGGHTPSSPPKYSLGRNSRQRRISSHFDSAASTPTPTPQKRQSTIIYTSSSPHPAGQGHGRSSSLEAPHFRMRRDSSSSRDSGIDAGQMVWIVQTAISLKMPLHSDADVVAIDEREYLRLRAFEENVYWPAYTRRLSELSTGRRALFIYDRARASYIWDHEITPDEVRANPALGLKILRDQAATQYANRCLRKHEGLKPTNVVLKDGHEAPVQHPINVVPGDDVEVGPGVPGMALAAPLAVPTTPTTPSFAFGAGLTASFAGLSVNGPTISPVTSPKEWESVKFTAS